MGSHKADARAKIDLKAVKKPSSGGKRRAAQTSPRRGPIVAFVALALVLGGGGLVAAQVFSGPTDPILTSAPSQAEFGATDDDLCEGFSVPCSVEWVEAEEEVGALLEQVPAAGERASSVKLTYSQGPATVVVPIVAGLPQSEVAHTLWAAGLELGKVEEGFFSAPAGTVFSASETPGTEVERGTTVDVRVATGEVKVPNWKGKTKDFIVSEASRLALNVEFKTKKTDELAPGIAMSQSAKGVVEAEGLLVTVVVSAPLEDALRELPDLVGLGEVAAISSLAAEGFLTIKTVTTVDPSVDGPVVTKTTPAAGEEISLSTEVVVHISVPKKGEDRQG